VWGNRGECAGERSHCSCVGCSGGPTPRSHRAEGCGTVAAVPAARWPHLPRSMAFLHSPVSPPVAVALPHSSSSASCTSSLFGASLLHFPTPQRKPRALPRSSASAFHCAECFSAPLLTSTLSLPALRRKPLALLRFDVRFVLCCRVLSGLLLTSTLALPALRRRFCIVRRLRIVPSAIQFRFQRHLLRPPLNPVSPTMRFGVGCVPGDSRPGPGRLCSMHPPPSHSDLDADANYTALTPRPRLSSPSCALLITSPIVTRSSCFW
jgi:hypothetical protein